MEYTNNRLKTVRKIRQSTCTRQVTGYQEDEHSLSKDQEPNDAVKIYMSCWPASALNQTRTSDDKNVEAYHLGDAGLNYKFSGM